MLFVAASCEMDKSQQDWHASNVKGSSDKKGYAPFCSSTGPQSAFIRLSKKYNK